MVALGSVVTCASLAEDEVVGAGKLAEQGTDRTHGAGLEVDKGGVGHVAAADGRVIVHAHALELEVGVMVGAGGDDQPELRR